MTALRPGQRFGELVVLPWAPSKSSHVWCHCSCGVEREFWRKNVSRGLSRSCGHTRGDATRFGSRWEGHVIDCIGRLERSYRLGASRRLLSFELTSEEFARLIGQPCHYCGEAPQRRRGYARLFLANGIDRRDSRLGYSVANCAPCCTRCNIAKGASTYADFVDWLSRIAAFRARRALEVADGAKHEAA